MSNRIEWGSHRTADKPLHCPARASSGTAGSSGTDVLVITNIRSYHQVDLFDAISSRRVITLRVVYLMDMTPGRLWKHLPVPKHAHASLPVWFGRSRMYFNPGLLAEIWETRPRMVLICQYIGLSNLIAMLALSARRVPWVFWSESPGVEFFEVKSHLAGWVRALGRSALLSLIGVGAQQVWGVGREATAKFGALTGLPARNLPYYSKLDRFRRILDKGHDAVRILFAGRCSYRKGFDTFLKVVERLAKQDIGENWKCTVCGDGDLLGQVERLSANARARVTLIGFKELDAMPGVYAEHDILLCPSRYDGWGMVVPEALAAGLVVFSTTAMGSAREIGPSPGHLVFDPNDVDGMIAALSAVIEHRWDIPVRSQEAVKAAMNYDAEIGAARFERFVRDVLATEGASPLAMQPDDGH